MKKIVALVLALVMVLSLSSVAFAAPWGGSWFQDYPGVKKEITEKVSDLVKDAAGKVAKVAGYGAWFLGGDYAKTIWGYTEDDVASITDLAGDILENWNKPFYNVASILNFKYQIPFLVKKTQKDAGEAVADNTKKWIGIGIWTAGKTHDVAVDAGSQIAGEAVTGLTRLFGNVVELLGGGIWAKGNIGSEIIKDRFDDLATKTDATIKEYKTAANENVAAYWANKILEKFGETLLTSWGYTKNTDGLYVLVDETLVPEAPEGSAPDRAQLYQFYLAQITRYFSNNTYYYDVDLDKTYWADTVTGKDNYAENFANDKANAVYEAYMTQQAAWNAYQEFLALLAKQNGVEAKTDVLYNIITAPFDYFQSLNRKAADNVQDINHGIGGLIALLGKGIHTVGEEESGVADGIANVLGYLFRFGDKTNVDLFRPRV